MQRIALVGSRELSERLIHYVESTGWGHVAGLFDDYEPAGSSQHGKEILGDLAAIPRLHAAGAFDALLLAIGYRDRTLRARVYEELRARGMPFATFIHPRATIDPSAVIGAGSIVLTDCTIEMRARIGENVFLSPRCFLSHDVEIGDHTYCAPAIALAGRTRVGRGCFLGIGTIAIEGVTIGDGARSAAGAVIIAEAPAGALVAGVPAVVKRPS